MPGRLTTATDVDRLQQPQTSTRGREVRVRLKFSRQCNALGREVLRLKAQWRNSISHLVRSALEFMLRLAIFRRLRVHPPRTASRTSISESGCSAWVDGGSSPNRSLRPKPTGHSESEDAAGHQPRVPAICGYRRFLHGGSVLDGTPDSGRAETTTDKLLAAYKHYDKAGGGAPLPAPAIAHGVAVLIKMPSGGGWLLRRLCGGRCPYGRYRHGLLGLIRERQLPEWCGRSA